MSRKTRAPRDGTSSVGWVVVVAAGALAMAGWVYLERTADVGPGVALYGGGFVGLGLLGSLARCLQGKDGIGTTLGRMRTVSRGDPIPDQFRALSAPGRSAWVLPLMLVPLMAATLPIAFATSPGDLSILGVGALFVGVLGYGGLLVGFLLWGMVVLPFLLLGRALTHRLHGGSSSDDDRWAAGLALLLLSVIVFAVSLVLSTPDTSEASTSSSQGNQFAALIGVSDAHVGQTWLLWVSRLAVAGVVVGGVLINRAERSRRRRGR